MTRLVDAMRALGLDGEIDDEGRWIRLLGERGVVHVLTTPEDDAYYVWCDDPDEQVVAHHDDPGVAILEGLRRAARHHHS
ncbi:MAG: hypothetical protein M3Q03_10175 [Chloroflexota bacterium]|nr:hypothetical protein [Chloroflexota bacterium]